MATATSVVQKFAQEEYKLKRKFEAAQREADCWYKCSLEKVAASNTAVKHHRSQADIGKLSGSAEIALERAQSANTDALMSQVHMLKITKLKLEAKVELRETKMRSLRRRLRKMRLLRLCRW